MKNYFLAILVIAMAITGCEKEPQEITNSTADLKSVTKSNNYGVLVSSNTSGVINYYDVVNGISNPQRLSFEVPYADADGIVYDQKRDAIYQVNRTDSELVAYGGYDKASDGDMLMTTATGPSTFSNGREATFYNNKVVIADDLAEGGRLVSYHVNEKNISDYREFNVDFQVWGIQIVGKDLWAIEDATNKLAWFQDFFRAKSGDLDPTAEVAIEGLVRTHGLKYDAYSDTMVLTDIGDAGSADDGAIVIISSFTTKFMAAVNSDGIISMEDQIRIAGDQTELGNPVDVDFSNSKNAIFVAERAQQKFLVFELPIDSGNYAPVYSDDVPGASAVTTTF
ncbi:hypothetical protein ML462_07995 [Gramella lutea]|uniref:Uncharacterized protein n=1 Tax=Christiangramia lutea TaxID=1607951 RepID=A0A9X1V3D4_9FLAO|nr:hypothetical protein [Christiangramia lutea]MCH4823115.1 hypothetical protein [Christiangramia lutea]